MEYFNYPLYQQVLQKRQELQKTSAPKDEAVTHPDQGKTVFDRALEREGVIETISLGWQHLEGYYFSALINFNGQRERYLWQGKSLFLSDKFLEEIAYARARFELKD